MSRSLRWSAGALPQLRGISTSAPLALEDSWISKLLVRKIEPTKEAHSRMLSEKDLVYALYTHNFRPDSRQQYLKNYGQLTEFIKSKNAGVDLVGSWTVSVGDMDQALHLYQYTGGFERVDRVNELFNNDKDYKSILEEQTKVLRSRHLQYILSFSYWPKIRGREGGNLYEVRSYSLKPGTMIEWGNNWARAISYRQNNDEAFAGFFSQIGRLYNVHHFWCYSDMKARRETRESAWRSPGWDECVAYTVPLIREMHCRILEPTAFSPTQ